MPLAAFLAATAVASLPPGGRFEETLFFGGQKWEVKASDTEVIGPGPNLFAPRNAWVDQEGKLHLRIVKTRTGWSCAEVRCARSLGYGVAQATFETPFDALDPNAVFGFFTWSDVAAQANREMDIEVSQWGRPKGPNLHFTVQPGPTAAFEAASPTGGAVLSIDHRPGRAEMSAIAPDGMELGRRSFTQGVPSIGGDMRLRFNLWLFRGKSPRADRPMEVVLSNFSFTPYSGGAIEP